MGAGDCLLSYVPMFVPLLRLNGLEVSAVLSENAAFILENHTYIIHPPVIISP